MIPLNMVLKAQDGRPRKYTLPDTEQHRCNPHSWVSEKVRNELIDNNPRMSIMFPDNTDNTNEDEDDMSTNGKSIGYLRVSSTDQTTARQLDGIALDKVFEDKASGKDADRAQLQAALDYLRDGDILHVHSIDRLARNLADLEKIVSTLTAKGVEVRFHKEGLTFRSNANDPMQTLLFHVMGAFAQFERTLIRERQREGIAAAKAAGKPLGRRAALTPAQIAEAKSRRAGGESAASLAKAFGISRATMYQHLGQTA